MYKLMGWAGFFVFSSIGWWMGQPISLFMAFLLSTIGGGIGMIAGRALAKRYY